jgi:hypothetical protein
MNFFQKLLDPNARESAGRFAFLLSIILSNTVVWGIWLVVCIYKREIVNIPEGVVMAYAAAQGLSFAGKGMQSFAESSSSWGTTTVRKQTVMAKSTMEVD